MKQTKFKVFGFQVQAILIAAMLVCSGAVHAQDRAGENRVGRFDVMIRGGKIVDGTGNGWFYGDVGIRGGRVAAVGDLSGAAAGKEIDASGLIVAPGFIDVHTHADSSLYELPYAENFLRDGVTTLVTGNCGGSVRDVRKYFDDLVTSGVAVNVATLYGHNTLLRQVDDEGAAPLSAEQMEKAKSLIRQAMKDGAVGFSTGLIYTPGKYSDTEEVIELAREAAQHGGMYVTHMRDESTEILAAIDEALRIGREAGCRVQISHFKVGEGCVEGGSHTTLGKVLAAREAGQEVWVDQYPYTASSTGMSVLFPDWLMENGSEAARKILEDPSQHERIFADMVEYHEGKRKRKSLEFAVIASSRAYPDFAGKSLYEVARRFAYREKHGEDSEWATVAAGRLPDVSTREQYAAVIEIQLKGGASCVYHSMAEEDVVNIMQSPLVAVCSDSGVRRYGSGNPHPRGYGSNARVLGRYVREQKVLSLEEAVRKMTSLPALQFRFRDRGLVREGYWADLTLFDPITVIDKATFANPHQYSEGIEYVIVNGEVVLAGGELTGSKPGQPVMGPARIEIASP